MKYKILETWFLSGNTIAAVRGNVRAEFAAGMEIEDENRIPYTVLSTDVKPEVYMLLPEQEVTLLLISGAFQGKRIVIPGKKKGILPAFPTLKP